MSQSIVVSGLFAAELLRANHCHSREWYCD